jgi:hypothetical protein
MTEEIDETGFWKKEFAEPHHIHSPNLSNWICDFLKEKKEKNIYDFGCGMGNYLNDLHKQGFKKLIGIEAEPPKTDYEFEILSKNLAHPFSLEEKGIVISLEVGEHIPKEYQNNYLDNITNNCSEYLIMSWAVKNQGGRGHFNELDNQEIIPEIEKRGFIYLKQESNEVRNVIEDSCSWFRNTLMIFKKRNMISINVLLTTIGREELKTRMLPSLVNQLNEEDYLTIVSDMNHDVVRDYLKEFDFKCVVTHIANPKTLGFYGHNSRNKYQNMLLGDYIMNADDDDWYADGAFDFIRSYVTEPKLYIFKHQCLDNFAWREHKVEIGNVGTSCGVISNSHNLPEWEEFYGGDGAFYVSLSKIMPYEFVDYVIYKIRHTE